MHNKFTHERINGLKTVQFLFSDHNKAIGLDHRLKDKWAQNIGLIA